MVCHMNRKGMELSMNMIIVAVLALLVLGIIAYLLINGTTNWNKSTKCENQGGSCEDLSSGKGCPDAYPLISAYSCDNKKTCCTKSPLG